MFKVSNVLSKCKVLGTALAIGVIVVACGGGGGGTSLTYAQRWVRSLNADDPFSTYTLVKDPTSQKGYIVVSTGTEYRAVYMDGYLSSPYTNYADYFNNESIWVYSSGNGYYKDFWGNLYETTQSSTKDLEKAAALVEELQADKVAETLANDYGLSEKRSLQVARLTMEWNKLSKKRSVTDADADAFSTQVLGFSLSDGIKAVRRAEKEGKKDKLDALIERAAQTNGISPEHVNDLIEKFAKQ